MRRRSGRAAATTSGRTETSPSLDRQRWITVADCRRAETGSAGYDGDADCQKRVQFGLIMRPAAYRIVVESPDMGCATIAAVPKRYSRSGLPLRQ
jgi:hypothetical protein